MNQQIYLVGISGSLRQKSYNTSLLKAVQEVLPEGVSMEIASYAHVPVYNADQDMPIASERPKEVEAFRDILAKANGLVIASPEYNYGIPGGLKNAIDWASRGKDSPLLGKPVALMGATPGMWGTARMQQAFLPLFQYLNMKPVYKPEILVARAKQKFDENGRLIDKDTREFLRQKIVALQQMIINTEKSAGNNQ